MGETPPAIYWQTRAAQILGVAPWQLNGRPQWTEWAFEFQAIESKVEKGLAKIAAHRRGERVDDEDD